LVDDGSTDAGTGMARDWAARNPDRVRYLEHEGHRNLGISASRNCGLSHARGEYVAFLDSDDVWFPAKLAEQVAIMDAQPGVAMVYGRTVYWRKWDPAAAKGDFTIDLALEADVVHAPPSLLLRCYPLGAAPTPCPSDVMLRKSAVSRIGGFEERFRGIYMLYEDQAFYAKIFLESPVFVASACWDRYRIHDQQCVSVVTGAGQYHTVRSFYLDWFASYLERKRVGDRALLRALRKARRPYAHPWLDRLLKRLQGRAAAARPEVKP
jgi:glycosyltransferase involved in cell wall biosynthesis